MAKTTNPWVAVKSPATPTVASAIMSAKEAAVYIGVHERTLYALTKSGQIVCTRFGTGKKTLPRYLKSDLDAFLAAHRVTAKAEGGDA